MSLAGDPHSADYWRSLAPSLHIESSSVADGWTAAARSSERELEFATQVASEGWSSVPALLGAEERRWILDAITSLRANRWPPIFAFVFDELWQIPARMGGLMTQILGEGFLMLPDFWAWYLDPATTDAGWRPHRDKGFNTLDEAGRPTSVTVWVALTEATAANGCIYLLPANRDPLYGKDFINNAVYEPQEIRAVPAAAGTALCWSQALLHWGGRCDADAPPRVSFACEFQRGDVFPYNVPLLDPHEPPPLETRLTLISKQLLQYDHMYPLTEELAELARALSPPAEDHPALSALE